MGSEETNIEDKNMETKIYWWCSSVVDKFFPKDQIINILGFVEYMVSIATTQLLRYKDTVMYKV